MVASSGEAAAVTASMMQRQIIKSLRQGRRAHHTMRIVPSEMILPQVEEETSLAVRISSKEKRNDLTAEEWGRIETVAKERNDFDQGCSICMESFSSGPEVNNPAVLLSCTHTFHLHCLEAAERCLGSKKRSCPICRKKHYQARLTNMAAAAARTHAAIRLQAGARRYIARHRYYKKLRHLYNRGGGNPQRRRQFLESGIISYGDFIQQSLTKQEDSLNTLFAECDRALRASTQVFGTYETTSSRMRETRNDMEDCGVPEVPTLPMPSEADWKRAIHRAQLRGETNCAICRGHLRDKKKNVLILVCSHEFHASCLCALEDFALNPNHHRCPCCRAAYKTTQKRLAYPPSSC